MATEHGGNKISDLELFNQVPSDGDYFPMVKDEVLKETVRIPVSVFRDMFLSRRAVPGSATSSGTAGDIAFDDDYIYYHTGSVWNRIPKSGQVDWTVDVAALEVPTQEGVYSISSGEQVLDISYPTSFSGNPPRVAYSIEYIGTGTPTLITGVITNRTISGFQITLSSPVPSTDYELYWLARQIS